MRGAGAVFLLCNVKMALKCPARFAKEVAVGNRAEENDPHRAVAFISELQ